MSAALDLTEIRAREPHRIADGWAARTRRPLLGADGRPSHLDLGSFRFSRTPYDPAADIPGDIHPDRWH